MRPKNKYKDIIFHEEADQLFNEIGGGQVANYGMSAGSAKPGFTKLGLPHGSYKLQKIPLKQINVGTHEHPHENIDPLGDTGNEEAAKEYSQLKTQAPPIMLRPDKGGFKTLDGVHRSRAAALRGEKDILAYVHQPKDGFEKNEKIKYSGKIESLTKGARGDWQSEGYTIKPTHQNDEMVQFTAYDKKGEYVGHANFIHTNSMTDKPLDEMFAETTRVHPKHQRKGLATSMYRMAEKHMGRPVRPSSFQSESAQKLWNQPNRPFGKSDMFQKYEGKLKSFANAAAGLATAASLATAQPAQAGRMDVDGQSQATERNYQPSEPGYSKDHILRSIAMVESSGGKNTKHERLPQNSIHQGERAYGSYGLTPLLIRETAKLHKDIGQKHPELSKLRGDDLHAYMKKNPNLEQDLASRHYDRLAQHFGHDPNKIAYAWLNGITGTKKAINKNFNIQNHWHVKKIRNALKNIKSSKN